MATPEYRPNAYAARPSLRVRLAALALSIATVALILAVLIAMGLLDRFPGGASEHLGAITMSSRNQEAQKQHSAKAAHARTAQVSQPVIPVPHPAIVPPILSKAPPVAMIPMSHADMAASDISKMGGHAGTGSGHGTYGPGEGPGGSQLYNAEWYREPSDAEINGYLPKGAPPGSWALIACKTIEHFHVEDCMQLGESPPGSGLARAMRQAAWQFLVRPPRVDGKPMIGAWVRIHIEFSRLPKGAGPDPQDQPERDNE